MAVMGAPSPGKAVLARDRDLSLYKRMLPSREPTAVPPSPVVAMHSKHIFLEKSCPAEYSSATGVVASTMPCAVRVSQRQMRFLSRPMKVWQLSICEDLELVAMSAMGTSTPSLTNFHSDTTVSCSRSIWKMEWRCLGSGVSSSMLRSWSCSSALCGVSLFAPCCREMVISVGVTPSASLRNTSTHPSRTRKLLASPPICSWCAAEAAPSSLRRSFMAVGGARSSSVSGASQNSSSCVKQPL
mmetsp:Transcript_5240/g.9988  ORF Transcript_5240/g.9988 Transcript_5240/m.9988 type:complete len:242 (+) Transcript_5240:916-1641(+)